MQAELLIADGQSYAGGCSGGRSQALARQPLRLGVCTAAVRYKFSAKLQIQEYFNSNLTVFDEAREEE